LAISVPSHGRSIILYILTCGPLILSAAAWLRLRWAPREQRHALALLALGITSANAVLACATFLYYELMPPSGFVPPWQDSEILNLGILFLLAPIGMTLGVVAAFHGAPRWIIAVIEMASLPLFAVGVMASISV
jgi:hypothetical protein